ncbi:serine hydrolase-like protein [Colletes gigas]|uniref:serine hydrolase-like protein n=1 Tax=Colletes gigas TaxID=935657 RepID=UPI001C9BB339|nr:serine hydrolase-like protein [Colletes gigas]XP_043256453.1 serine hydrolase-like protein [Colletes gigas]XP_043256454.1 serine hydrolase-like protein [Colletes gigas]XP_043256455.1 serine hydrolase-like protein [Colletes gigas]XP_043256457.1 serine hydrolase-like protein [Colletes gigas]XP_043256458.1 serine hydrolase-like protein [Colletes gigas]
MNQLKRQPAEVKLPVPWGHVAAKIYGPLQESKILVVHGYLDNAGSFNRLLEFLPEHYNYVCIDLPGHGLSSPFPSGVPLKFFDYVYSILLVLDALKWQTCIYMGHSFGAQIGTYFSILYPGRLEKIIAIDGIMPFPIKNLVSYTQQLYDLDSYNNTSEKLYTKDEIMHALKFRRQEVLNTDAAEAMFERAVTKIDNLYKYNRDPRLRFFLKPLFTIEQSKEFLMKFLTPILIILADNSTKIKSYSYLVKEIETSVNDKSIFLTVVVRGNHDVHNNYPERVAPHICHFLGNTRKSKL